MKKQISIFIIFLIIVAIIAYILFYYSNGRIELDQAITIGLLVITGIFVWFQSWETRKMAEYQLMPAVDVNMQYDKNIGKTFLWFYNSSNFPVIVNILVLSHIKSKIELRLPPKKEPYFIRKTATHYDFPKCELTLDISLKPAIMGYDVKYNFTKSYYFDSENLQWNESTWAFPDEPYPL